MQNVENSDRKQALVFVSSTFRDMHSERDYLVRHVFPELRDWCQKTKGITLVELDLRWGVTEKEAENGEVLNICLSEIERSRPFFIGLLGERYGWIPPARTAPDGPILDWLNKQDERSSITALEVLKGVLDDPVMPNLSHFYFRNPAFTDQVPAVKRHEVTAENEEARQHQTELKQQIRDFYGKDSQNLRDYNPRYGGLKLNWLQVDETLKAELGDDEYALTLEVASDGFIDPDEWGRLPKNLREKLQRYLMVNLAEESLQDFGRQVLADLKIAIDSRYEDKPAHTDPVAIERTAHRDFLVSKTGLFVGRDKELQRGRDLLRKNPSLYVCGDGGTGKSAYLANLVHSWQEADPDQRAYYYFLGTTERTQNLLSMLETAYREIRTDLKLDTGTFPDRVMEAAEFFSEFLSTIEGPVMLAFDAIDQLQDHDIAFDLRWIPKELPEHVTIVLSSLPGKGRERAESRGIPIFDLAGLSAEHSRNLVTEYLAFYRKKLGYDSGAGEDQLELLLSKRDARLPLYLVTASEELRIFPRYEEITMRIGQLPDRLSELFEQIIAQLETDFGVRLVERALSLIAVSRVGLTEDELLSLLSPEGLDRLPPMIWSRFYLRIKAYLRGTQTTDGLLGFFHRELTEAVQVRYLRDKEQVAQLHRELGEYFSERAKGNDASHAWETGYARGFSENVYHCLRAGDIEMVERIFEDFAYPLEKVKHDGLQSLLEDGRWISNYGGKTPRLLQIWADFLTNVGHLLKQGNRKWPSYKILVQLAMQHADDSPITQAAARFVDAGRVTWTWAMDTIRPAHVKPNYCIAVLDGHTSEIRGALIREDGSILSWSRDRTLRLWSREGEQLAVMEGHTGIILDAITRDDGSILSRSGDHTLRLWSHDGHPLAVLRGHTDSVDGAMIRDDDSILSWSSHTLRLWSHDGEPLAVLEDHTSSVEGAIIKADGSILSWSRDATLRLWSHDGQPLAVLEGHTSSVEGAIIRGDGSILSWSNDYDLRLWSCDGQPLVVMEGHTESVEGVALRDDDSILSWSGHTLRLWSREGLPVAVMKGHTNALRGATIRRDGSVLSWSHDNTLRLWSHDGRPLSVMEDHSDTVWGAVIRDNDSILSWSSDRTLRLWSHDGQPLAILKGHTDHVGGAIVGDDDSILSWSGDHTLRVWSPDGEPIAVLEGHTEPIHSVVTRNDGSILSWCSLLAIDNTLRLWSYDALRSTISKHLNEPIDTVITRADGAILSWSSDHDLRLWSRNGQPLAVLKDHTDSVTDAIIRADGSILSWSKDRTLRLWSTDGVPTAVLEGHTGEITGVIIRDDGTILSWSRDHALRLWSQDGQPLAVMAGHTSWIHGACIRDDGSILSWSGDHTLRLWSFCGQPLAVMKGHTSTIKGIRIRDDGSILSWCSLVRDDHALRLWSPDGQPLAVLEGHTGPIADAVIRDDGSILSWCSSVMDDHTLRLWSCDGQPLAVLGGHTSWIQGVRIRDDGSILSWAREPTPRLWSRDGQQLAVLEGHKFLVEDVVVREDGSILSRAADDTLRLWSPDGQPSAVMIGHTANIQGMIIRDDGSILSWSVDQTLRLWSHDGQSLAVMTGHNSWIQDVCIREDGSILSWSSDHTLHLWSRDGQLLWVVHTANGPEGRRVNEHGNLVIWKEGNNTREFAAATK